MRKEDVSITLLLNIVFKFSILILVNFPFLPPYVVFTRCGEYGHCLKYEKTI